MNRHYDLIVVGLGAMGAATVYQATCLGLNVLGIDRFDPPHEFGSSHAETRVTRLAVGEGPQYLPFVRRSHEIWRELEAQTGHELLHQSGGLIICNTGESSDERWGDFVNATASVAADARLDYELPTNDEVRARYPELRITDAERAGFEPTGGVVMCERAIAVQLDLARVGGADIRTNEPVLDVTPGRSNVAVTTADATLFGEQVVLTTGAWLPGMVDQTDRQLLAVTRQVVHWFEVDDLAAFSPQRFPTVIWASGSIEEYIGVFPTPPGATRGLKVLGEQFSETTDADSVDRQVTADETAAFYEELIRPRIAGVRPNCIRSAVCLYTNTPDDHFLIDTSPDSDRVMVVSPCSGHGFKHSAALGEAIGERIATGASTLDLTVFARRPKVRT